MMHKEEILLNCIDDIQSGRRSLQDCLAAHPELAIELKEFDRIMRGIGSEAVAPTVEFKRRARSRLRAEIAATRAGSTIPGNRFRLRLGWKLAYTMTSILLFLAIGSGSVAYASQTSLPSDTLYPVKTGVENLQLALTFSRESKAGLHMKLAERRVQEVIDELAMGRDITDSALEAAINQIDGALNEVLGTSSDASRVLLDHLSESTLNQQAKLEQLSDKADQDSQTSINEAIKAARRGTIIARVASSNPSLLDTGVSIRDEDLEETYFEIEGNVVRAEEQTWNIGGIELGNVKSPDSAPAIGTRVKIYGLIRSNETYIGKIENREDEIEEGGIRGVFTGKDDDGKWSVSGIPVGQSENVTTPAAGDEVEVRGKVKDGVFNIERSESRGDRHQDEDKDNDRSAGYDDKQRDSREGEASGHRDERETDRERER